MRRTDGEMEVIGGSQTRFRREYGLPARRPPGAPCPKVITIPSSYAPISTVSEYAEAGLLRTYGASLPGLWYRSATYVDKILKGRKPADLPIEQPTKFELVINLKTAKQIGLTIPQSVLQRADEVIQ